MNKTNSTIINFNYDVHVKELVDRFSRLIKQLGPNNRKDWKADPPVATQRYQFEVDFAYAIRDLSDCPTYLQGKMFDQASGVVNGLARYISTGHLT